MIDPSITRDGELFETYAQRRWGSSSWTGRLKQEGSKDGAPFANWLYACNTLKAHELIHAASIKFNVDTSLSNAAIFKAVYEEGKNISLVDTLMKIALEDLGIPSEEEEWLRRYLENDEGAQEVRQEIQQGRSKYNISGVPFFVIEKEGDDSPPYGLSGAQKSSTFTQVFEELSSS